MIQEKENNRIAKNSVYLSIRLFFILLITLYSTRVILNILGIQDYGIYNAVAGFISMFTFLNTSMANGIQRFMNYEIGLGNKEKVNTIYNNAFYIQIIVSVVILILAETFGLWFLSNKMIIPESRRFAAFFIFQTSLLSFLFVIIQSPFVAVIMAYEKMNYYAFIGVIDSLIKLLIIIILPYIKYDNLIVYGILFSTTSFINLLMYYLYIKKRFSFLSFNFHPDYTYLKPMIYFSGWNLFGTFANIMKEQGINLVMNIFFGPFINAARGVAGQVNGGLQAFVGNIGTAIRPQIIQSYAKKDFKRTMELTYSISKFSCIFLYIISLPVLLEIDIVLNIWLGSNIPPHTQTFILIIVLTSFISNLNMAISSVVHASGRMKKYQIYSSIIIILSIPSSYIFFKLGFPAEYGLIMGFIFVALSQCVSLIILKTIIKFSIIEYIKRTIIPFFICILTSCWIPLCFRYYLDEGYLRFLLVIISSFLSSSVCGFYFVLSNKERIFVRSYYKKLTNEISHKNK